MDFESSKELCILIIFGILLPSFDVYSDIAFSISLCFGQSLPLLGSIFLIPVALTTFFTIPKWWKREKTLKQKLFTFPLLIGQLWPQWEALKVIRMIWKSKNQWKEEKKKMEVEISSLGKQTLFQARAVFKSKGRIHIEFFFLFSFLNRGLKLSIHSNNSYSRYVIFFSKFQSPF